MPPIGVRRLHVTSGTCSVCQIDSDTDTCNDINFRNLDFLRENKFLQLSAVQHKRNKTEKEKFEKG